MRCAVILADDPGERLRPMTDDDTPTAFLALGGRRTLLERSISRLADCVPVDRVWVVVAPKHLARARAALGPAVGGTADAADALSGALAQITPAVGAVLVQPATHVVEDEVGFRARISAGLDVASSRGGRVSFTVQGHGSTGIEAWPAALLRARLSCAGAGGPESIRGVLSATEGELTAMPLDGVGWLDVSDWKAIRRLLDRVEKPWGYERLWALNRHYAGKILFIRAGESLSLQYHERKDETIRLLSGRMRLRAGPSAEALETVILEPGTSYEIPSRLVHRMEALEDCTVLEVSTPHLTDVVRLEDRYGRS